MIAITAKMLVKPGCEEKFEQAMLALVSAVNVNEPGNLLYELCKDDNGQYLVMELYKDEEAVQAHRTADHIKNSGPSFKGLMSGPPIIKKMSVIPRAV
jgi:quinol monooxygenase YgiN